MLRRTTIIATVLILVLLVSGVAFAEGENLDSLKSAMKNSDTFDLGSGKSTLIGMSRDFFDIARYIVISALLIRSFMLFFDFSGAGDDPHKKESIKSKAVWLSFGIVFALNFWSIYNFTARVMSNLSF